MEFESKLIPILREGVDTVKMILFKNLRDYLSEKHPSRESSHITRLSGAIINELFGTPNTEQAFAAFALENRASIEEEMKNLAVQFRALRIPLTDALRVQFLCDAQEGIDSESVLSRARELDILIVDREVPLPAQFVSLVRKLGGAMDILAFQPAASALN